MGGEDLVDLEKMREEVRERIRSVFPVRHPVTDQDGLAHEVCGDMIFDLLLYCHLTEFPFIMGSLLDFLLSDSATFGDMEEMAARVGMEPETAIKEGERDEDFSQLNADQAEAVWMWLKYFRAWAKHSGYRPEVWVHTYEWIDSGLEYWAKRAGMASPEQG